MTEHRAHAVPAGPVNSGSGGDVSQLRADLETYLQKRGAAEHISAAGLSVNLPDRRSTIDVGAGTTTFGGTRRSDRTASGRSAATPKRSPPCCCCSWRPSTGCRSTTRSAGGCRSIGSGGRVTIRRLLNMTSGIATYDDQPAWYADYAANPHTYFTPGGWSAIRHRRPGHAGYSYSNTNYVLAEMIIERVTGSSYQNQLYRRIIDPLRLLRPVLPARRLPGLGDQPRARRLLLQPPVPAAQAARTRRQPEHAVLGTRRRRHHQHDERHDPLGTRALRRPDAAAPSSRGELESLVSTKTGRPIAHTSAEDPEGSVSASPSSPTRELGRFWFYEGETLAFRTCSLPPGLTG